MSGPLVFLDVETTGLDPRRHEVWEIAYAVGHGPVEASFVSHEFVTPDPAALRVNRYLERCHRWDPLVASRFEDTLQGVLRGATLVGANPAFDAAFLTARWGHVPWHHRLLDVEAYAMAVLGYDELQGQSRIRADLASLGYYVPKPDHTALADVECVRACFFVLREMRRRGGDPA